MRNYWSCSKLADWLRGTTKLKCGTGDEWKDWKLHAKANHTIRWWLAEEGLDHLQDFIMYIPDKFRNVRFYINNRFLTRSHALTAHPRDIKPGSWCDVGDRFIFCLFNELVDFVEIENAWMAVAFSTDTRKKFKPSRQRLWGWKGWRDAEAGLHYLDWEASLVHGDSDNDWIPKDSPCYGKPTQQAIAATEIKELYFWWTNIRPNRKDAFDISGWSAYCANKRHRGIGLMEADPLEDKEYVNTLLKLSTNIENGYETEDTEMLIRLIKLRDQLWT